MAASKLLERISWDTDTKKEASDTAVKHAADYLNDLVNQRGLSGSDAVSLVETAHHLSQLQKTSLQDALIKVAVDRKVGQVQISTPNPTPVDNSDSISISDSDTSSLADEDEWDDFSLSPANEAYVQFMTDSSNSTVPDDAEDQVANIIYQAVPDGNEHLEADISGLLFEMGGYVNPDDPSLQYGFDGALQALKIGCETLVKGEDYDAALAAFKDYLNKNGEAVPKEDIAPEQ